MEPTSPPPDTFKTLLRDYRPMAYRMAFQITGGRDAEAQDLVQEVFVKIWARWSNYRPDSIKSWMYRVLKNLYIDAARHRARHPALSLETTDSQDVRLEELLSDRRPALDAPLEQQEIKNQVSAALAQMEEEFRTPVMLCDMEGLAYEDIARILACPIGTVRSRIHRGRSQLRRLLPAVGAALAIGAWTWLHFCKTPTPIISPRPLEAQHFQGLHAHPLIALQPDSRSKDTQ